MNENSKFNKGTPILDYFYFPIKKFGNYIPYFEY